MSVKHKGMLQTAHIHTQACKCRHRTNAHWDTLSSVGCQSHTHYFLLFVSCCGSQRSVCCTTLTVPDGRSLQHRNNQTDRLILFFHLEPALSWRTPKKADTKHWSTSPPQELIKHLQNLTNTNTAMCELVRRRLVHYGTKLFYTFYKTNKTLWRPS